MSELCEEVQEKTLESLLISGIRMRGKYGDCGPAFGKLGRKVGRFICGPAMMLHYCNEYRENDADFEVCFPVRQAKPVEGVSLRELPGGRAVSLLHCGPYDRLHGSYDVLRDYVKAKGYQVELPSREVYLKGPGMIFKGNPEKYLTEIQMLVR